MLITNVIIYRGGREGGREGGASIVNWRTRQNAFDRTNNFVIMIHCYGFNINYAF